MVSSELELLRARDFFDIGQGESRVGRVLPPEEPYRDLPRVEVVYFGEIEAARKALSRAFIIDVLAIGFSLFCLRHTITV